MANNESEIKPSKPRKQTPKQPFLVEVETDENNNVKAIKGLLALPSTAKVKGNYAIAKKIELACCAAADDGSQDYHGKTMMVLTFTRSPFSIESQTTFTAKSKTPNRATRSRGE